MSHVCFGVTRVRGRNDLGSSSLDHLGTQHLNDVPISPAGSLATRIEQVQYMSTINEDHESSYRYLIELPAVKHHTIPILRPEQSRTCVGLVHLFN